MIVGVHADYVPLTSLEIIRGQTLFHDPKTNDDYSLYVKRNYNSSSNIGLKELRLTSLKGRNSCGDVDAAAAYDISMLLLREDKIRTNKMNLMVICSSNIDRQC